MPQTKNNARPIAIDLFAGAGGLSLGFEQAGFNIVCAVEIDPVHCATHKFNFPNCAILPKSVSCTTGENIRSAAGLAIDQEIDIIIGGPPCQGFSKIGKRSLDDPRNLLAKDFIRLVSELKPKYFLLENVKGLTHGPQLKFLGEIIAEFENVGYRVNRPWQVLNAKHYGVPQSRNRLFLLGTRADLISPEYPAKSDRTVTCKDALEDIPNADDFDMLLFGDRVKTELLEPHSAYADLMRSRSVDSWHYGHRRYWNHEYLSGSARTDHSAYTKDRFALANPGKAESISRFFKLHPDGVCNTLRAGTDSARGSHTSARPIHYQYSRCCTVREMARLHSFPDWFRFHVTKWHGARQIGNSVPPLLAKAIGVQFIKALAVVPTKPETIVELGDPSLLALTMSAAAKHFGVDFAIAQRTSKKKSAELSVIS
jgi:DNA (cytosine-5)-methyltransferase 1